MPADPARKIERNSPTLERAYADAPEGARPELVRGMLAMAPAPLPRHQVAAARLSAALHRSFDGPRRMGPSGPGGWLFMTEPELALGERPDRVRPDLAGWHVERVRFGPDTIPIELAPEWVCEVLSPSTEAVDRGPKADAYTEHGVAHLWLIDPELRTLEVYNRRGRQDAPGGALRGRQHRARRALRGRGAGPRRLVALAGGVGFTAPGYDRLSMTQCPVCESRHLEAECSTCTASRQAAAADDNVRLLVDIEVQPADAAQPRALARALAQRVIADLRRRGPWPGPVDRLARQLA